MNLSKDSKEFIELLNARNVEYVIVGAHAMAYHGYPRFTGDLDIFVRVSGDNAAKLQSVLDEFGFADTGLTAADFQTPDQVIQLGVAPNRIDIMTFLSGVTFDEAWATREEAELGGIAVPVLDKQTLIRNKRATGRSKDLADLENLP